MTTPIATDHSDATIREPHGALPRMWLGAVVIAAAFFVAIAPTLAWLEFAGGSENLVVETVLEMRRGGPWFIPTLQGYPRLNKPPLTAWLTAAAARPDTVARLSTRDPDARAAAFKQLAWQVRWPTLLSACVMLGLTCVLGDVLLGRPAGLLAGIACGSSLMFLRFCRGATTDVQLALWVTAANLCLTWAVVRGRIWIGLTGAGAALGLALMSKGPVAFAQSLAPFAVYFAWRSFARERITRGPEGRGGSPVSDPLTVPHRRGDDTPAPRARALWGPVAVGLLVMLAVALPWPLAVFRQYPFILGSWYQEVVREGATQLGRDPWYFYLVFLPWMVPALPFFVAGLWLSVLALRPQGMANDTVGAAEGKRDGPILALFLAIVPIVIMSFFKDKPERYVLPMAPAASILAAGAAVGWFRSGRRDSSGWVVEIAYWATLAVLAIGAPAMGLLAPRLNLGERWMTPVLAVAVGIATFALVVAGFVIARGALRRGRWEGGAVATFSTGAAVMLLLQYPFLRGYSRHATSDLKPLADAVWAKYPDATLHEYDPGTRTRTYLDLPIYAGRVSRKVRDLADLPQSDRPHVVVFFERRGGEADPPPPWQELAAGDGRKNRWRAYVLPAAP